MIVGIKEDVVFQELDSNHFMRLIFLLLLEFIFITPKLVKLLKIKPSVDNFIRKWDTHTLIQYF